MAEDGGSSAAGAERRATSDWRAISLRAHYSRTPGPPGGGGEGRRAGSSSPLAARFAAYGAIGRERRARRVPGEGEGARERARQA